jgi:hypothetical protein
MMTKHADRPNLLVSMSVGPWTNPAEPWFLVSQICDLNLRSRATRWKKWWNEAAYRIAVDAAPAGLLSLAFAVDKRDRVKVLARNVGCRAIGRVPGSNAAD